MADTYSAQPQQSPECERCHKARATNSLTFSYRGEEYKTRYYCEPCGELAWDEGVKEVDERAAKLKAAKGE